MFEHFEIGRNAGGDGVFLQETGAEAVDGGNPGSFDAFAMLGARLETLDEAVLDFRGGLFSKRDGEDAAGIDVMKLD